MMLWGLCLGLCAVAYAGDVTMSKVAYGGWEDCVRLTNGEIELIATTQVGPRVIRFGFVGGQNVFKEFEADLGQTGGDAWRPYGGHRLWHAPEAKPRTYSPDNGPVEWSWNKSRLVITQPTEADTGIRKAMRIVMNPDMNHVRVEHILTNENPWDVRLAPWALTMMAPGGRGVFPQEFYRSHTEYLLPARPLVLWHYTNMADPRWTWSAKYIQLRQDPEATDPEKVGFLNKQGWAAYVLNGEVFAKCFEAPDAEATYPDYNCNTETFTNAEILEVETLGPLTTLASEGGHVELVEDWYLFKADVGESDTAIDQHLAHEIQFMSLRGLPGSE